jgi:hypothetical protein
MKSRGWKRGKVSGPTVMVRAGHLVRHDAPLSTQRSPSVGEGPKRRSNRWYQPYTRTVMAAHNGNRLTEWREAAQSELAER